VRLGSLTTTRPIGRPNCLPARTRFTPAGSTNPIFCCPCCPRQSRVRVRVLTRLIPRVQLSNFPSPTTRRSILLMQSVLCASAAFMSVIVCFKVLVFDPKTTVPPITAAIAPIMAVGSNPTAPMIIAKIKVPQAATAALEIRVIFRHLSIMSVSSSMWASRCKICSCRSPSSSM
jgi:hypothetical protein